MEQANESERAKLGGRSCKSTEKYIIFLCGGLEGIDPMKSLRSSQITLLFQAILMCFYKVK